MHQEPCGTCVRWNMEHLFSKASCRGEKWNWLPTERNSTNITGITVKAGFSHFCPQRVVMATTQLENQRLGVGVDSQFTLTLTLHLRYNIIHLKADMKVERD